MIFLRKAVARGFSLIELLVVISIVALLAGIAVPAYQSYTTRAKVSAALTTLKAYQNQMMVYYGMHGTFPSQNEGHLLGWKYGNCYGEMGTPNPCDGGINDINEGIIRDVWVAGSDGLTFSTIGVRFTPDADIAGAANGSLFLIVTADPDGSISWQCIINAGLTPEMTPNCTY